MRLSILQLPIVIGDRKANSGKLQEMLATAMEQHPDTILLPELWDIGFFPRPITDFTDKNGEQTKNLLSDLAKQYNVNIVGGSIAEQCGESIKNTGFVFARTGKLIARYSKTHLFSPAKEQKTFTAGNKAISFTLDGIKYGIIICYGLRFPEMIRNLALEGIDILLIPAEWPTVRLDHWRCLTQARAVENQIYVAACNGSGAFANGMPLAGHSVIIDPWGRRMTEANDQPGIISADIDLTEKEKIRSTINIFADRRPDLY